MTYDTLKTAKIN